MSRSLLAIPCKGRRGRQPIPAELMLLVLVNRLRELSAEVTAAQEEQAPGTCQCDARRAYLCDSCIHGHMLGDLRTLAWLADLAARILDGHFSVDAKDRVRFAALYRSIEVRTRLEPAARKNDPGAEQLVRLLSLTMATAGEVVYEHDEAAGPDACECHWCEDALRFADLFAHLRDAIQCEMSGIKDPEGLPAEADEADVPTIVG
jgi:hypothetical protein